MIKFFFTIAFRNIKRQKGISFINIAGLTLSLTVCLLIGLFVWDENQYDKFIPQGDQVYRIYNAYTNNQGTENLAVTSPMFSSTLQRDFPEVEQVARVLEQPQFKKLFEVGKIRLYEENGFYADSSFFEVFPLPFKYGSSANSLDDPTSIVISEDMAKRFFGNENPVGKQMLKDKVPFQVKGVFEKNPKFHLQFDFLIPLAASRIPSDRMQSWEWQQFFTYVKLKKQTDVHALEVKFQNDVTQKSNPPASKVNFKNKPLFQPLKDIHLYSSGFKFDMAQRGNITYVNGLSITGVFILLIACFNFVNLATARSLQRAKEVGIRKTIGASRHGLMLQFMGETLLLSCISMLIATCLAVLLLPLLNDFTSKHIPASLLAKPFVLLLLVGSMLLTGLFAGFYPAIVLSGFKAVRVLKGVASSEQQPGKIPWLRHGLVVVQFTLSVLLIITAIVVFEQVDYLHTRDLGFNKEQIMFFPMRGDNMSRNYEAFKNELQKSPGVSAVSIGYGFPGDAVAGDEVIVLHNGEQKKQPATQLMVDYDYIRTLGIQLVAGRNFSKEMPTDKDHAFVINETAVRQLGLGTPQKALGQRLEWNVWDATRADSFKTGQVIGVVKDFHYKSFYDKMETAVLQIYPNAYWKVAVKMNAAGITNTITYVKNVWNKFTPDYPIEYKFLDENFEQMYTGEDKLRSLLGMFTIIAVFVGCLGLFGLAAYTAERRTKEVGIRKVLGASVKSVTLLLSKGFVKLVIISILIASPIAYYFMHQWLENFAYRIPMSWWMFTLAGTAALFIALATVSYQAIKAAIANPVKSLRTE